MHHPEAYDLATKIKMSQGGQEFLDRVAGQLCEELKPRLTEAVVFEARDPGQTKRTQYRIQRSQVSASVVRRLTKAAELRAHHPDVYREVVTETPPPTPYSVRLALAGRGTSREWKQWAEIGAERTRDQWERRVDPYADWRRLSVKAEWLRRVRAGRIAEEARESELRIELSELIAREGLELRLRGQGDGLIIATDRNPTRGCDYDLFALRYPELSRVYISESARAGYESILIHEVRPKPEPGEEDDDPWEGD
jgi:hypothetical protein